MKKVLIAEDSSVIQNLAKKILQMQDFSISSVKNGLAVMSKLESEDFDVILLDINMPGMDGMECARSIRALDSEKSKTPLIAITGNAKNYSREEFTQVGFDEYLQKPLDFDRLVETVKRLTVE